MRLGQTAHATFVAVLALGAFCALTALPLRAQAKPARAAPPAPMQGVVTQVTDGDTLRFTPTGQAAIVVRLRDIDAPEICQAWGPEARRALIDLALNKPATLHPGGHDSYGRLVGTLTVDDVNIGPRLVEEGHAWSARGRNDVGPLVKQERMAKALGRGLHAGGGAIKPSDFRRTNGSCADGAPVAQPVVSSAAVPRPATPSPAAPPAPGFRCDGRTRCTQMTSCDEARFFLANCPGVTMDGNHDGVPCERQWCRSR